MRPADEPEPIVTDRPDFTESSDTVPFGRMQLEGGYTFSRVGTLREHAFGELLLRIATGRRTEARIGINSHIWNHGAGASRGFEDTTLGMKVRLCPGSETFNLLRPTTALILETTIPTGSSAFSGREMQPGADPEEVIGDVGAEGAERLDESLAVHMRTGRCEYSRTRLRCLYRQRPV